MNTTRTPAFSSSDALPAQRPSSSPPIDGEISASMLEQATSRLNRPATMRNRGITGKVLGLALGVTLVGCFAYFGITAWSGSRRSDRPSVSIAKRADLRVAVSERGNVESQVTVDGICELYGYQNKITYIVPEGTRVKKGDIVCKFDGSEIQKNLAQQDIRVKQAISRVETSLQEREIQRNAGESTIIAAKVELALAELDLEKFQKGDYPAEFTKLEGEMRLKKKDVEAEGAKLGQYKALMKKGFKTTEDVRIQTSTLAAKELDYSSTQQFLDVKERFDRKRKLTEFTSKVDQCKKKVAQAIATARAQILKADSECVAARATSDIEQQQLREYLSQKEKTIITAQQSGILAYANDGSYDSSRQIREGATVYSRQKVFSLPDLTRMQVKVNVHESLIKKIKPGQRAEVQIDAFPNVAFTGSVKSVALLADSTRHWLTAGIKEYATIVTLDDLAGQDLKPGMTAESRIVVRELKDVLVVPLQAVTERDGEFYAFVDEPAGIEPRKLRIGESNESMIEILEGLAEGESVALDARRRGESDAGIDDPQDDPDQSSQAPGSLASRP